MGFAPFSFLTLGNTYLELHDFYCIFVPYLYRNKKGDKVQQINSRIIGNLEFLYYFMSSSYFKKAISRIVTEGTMKTAYLKDINNIRCPIPTKEKQQEIAKIPSAINSKIDFEQSILRLFYAQKQYLLRQMFI